MASGFDVDRFVRERRPRWDELEAALVTLETRGMRALGIDGARNFGKLYRTVSSDLLRARSAHAAPALEAYLNDLVARAYAHVYAGSAAREHRSLRTLFTLDVPRLVREEWRAMALSALLLFGSMAGGAAAVTWDPRAYAVLLPEDHAELTPTERVEGEAVRRTNPSDRAAEFSSFLFTHNIRVTFLLFALGLTAGLGTASVLVTNGVPIGALAVQYHQAGHGLFFWSWILPHGIPELTAIVIAGAAGFVLGRGVVRPGRRTRVDALRHEASRATRLVVGAMPILVLAGMIEGTISQLHPPTMPYGAKLLFSGLVGAGLFAWLLLAGRSGDSRRAGAFSSPRNGTRSRGRGPDSS